MGSSFIPLVGVVATIDWTWHGSRRPLLDLSAAAVG